MDDEELYHPPSDFLCAVIAEEIGFGADPYGRANLAQLVALTADADDANRDWATFLLAESDQDDAAVRAALRARLDDASEVVRDQALVGVAMRERAVALPLVQGRLGASWVSLHVIEAAGYVADRTLLPALQQLQARDDGSEKWVSDELARSVTACRTGEQPYWRENE